MPLLFCRTCKSSQQMRVAVSRIRVRPAQQPGSDVTTRTSFCPACRSLVLGDDRTSCSAPRKARTQSTKIGSGLRPGRIAAHRLIIALVTLLLAACSTVPITHRRQLDLVPASEMMSMSFSSYKDFLSKHKVIENTPEAQMVQRVGTRIQHAVEQYFAQHNLSSELKGYAWEFHLVDDKEINAWCMPGGKVVVYSGLIPVAQDDNGLAVVLGHEISHAVARHGDERMSQGLLAEMGGVALSVALAQKPAQTQQLFMAAYGAGAQVGVLLPYSRVQESEADHLGLIFMAMAGYDPRTAVSFWERMTRTHQGSSPPELLSTHPADATRIKNIEKLMPEALKYYKAPAS